MLIQFNLKNFKSFKNETTLDMSATSIKENMEYIIFENDERYLKLAAIYGANASGKSNVIEAFSKMQEIILKSFRFESKWKEIPLKRFALDGESKNQNSMFEVFFKCCNEVYQYGFELDSYEIKEEWLYKRKKNKTKNYELLFFREKDRFELSKGLKTYEKMIVGISEKTLVLSFLANIKIEDIKNVYDWFREIKVINFGNPILDMTLARFLPGVLIEGDKDGIEDFNNFLKNIDVSIESIKVEKDEANEANQEIGNGYKAFSVHTNNDTKEKEYLNLREESDGTLKMISMYSHLKNVLKSGGTIFIDELDAKLHTLLTKYIIQLFHNPKTNPNNAQLIYTTHDVVNLKKENFRRDEIWFVQKNEKKESELYSLVEYKINNSKIRNDASYSKNYLLGKYGAVPILKEFEEE